MAKTMFLVLSFLLSNSLLCLAAEEPNPVRDTEGNILRQSNDYYILPVRRGSGGGVTWGSPLNSSYICPFIVVQAPSELSDGDSVVFTPKDPKKGVIRVSTDLNIRFSAFGAYCRNRNVWKTAFSQEIGLYIINTNGEEGNPGPDTLDNWFKIEEYMDQFYRLVHCPTLCDDCKPLNCIGVGIYYDQKYGRRVLTLRDEDPPFLVQFKKASLENKF